MNKYARFLIEKEEKSKKRNLIYWSSVYNDLLLEVKMLASRYTGINKVIVFGSIADNSFNKYSDVDLLIESLTGEEYYEVKRILEDALGVDIDLYTQSDSTRFVNRIKERGTLIYERKS